MIEGARCYGRVILLDILLLLILVACSTMRTTRQSKQSVAGASVSFLMPQSFAGPRSFDNQIFEEMFDTYYSTWPGRSGVVGAKPAVWVSGFVGERMVGSISRLAMIPPFRTEENDQAKRLRYPVTKYPYVPLQGKVVAETPGLLEVYQTHILEKTQADASALLRNNEASTSGGEGGGSIRVSTSIGISTMGDRSYVFQGSTGLSPTDEHIVGVGVEKGREDLLIIFRGGVSISYSRVRSLVAAAIKKWHS
jgi:hypothetical protein